MARRLAPIPCRTVQATSAIAGDSLRLLEALGCGVLVLEADTRILCVNRRAAELLGRSAEKLTGRCFRELYRRFEPDPAVAHVLDMLTSGVEYDFFLPLPDGARRPVTICGRAIETTDGRTQAALTLTDAALKRAAEVEASDSLETISRLTDALLAQSRQLDEYAHTLEQRVRERTQELHEANIAAISMLAIASEIKDGDTGAHIRRIQGYATALARRLGLPATECERIGYSAILHDVGKMQVADAILKKRGALTVDERLEIELHTLAGERILSQAPFFDIARQIARGHHENWDGSGYPDGLSGEQIPMPARIVRVVDVYDGLTSERPYKQAWAADKALRYIVEGAGTLFDPGVVAAFQTLFEAGELACGPPEA